MRHKITHTHVHARLIGSIRALHDIPHVLSVTLSLSFALCFSLKPHKRERKKEKEEKEGPRSLNSRKQEIRVLKNYFERPK